MEMFRDAQQHSVLPDLLQMTGYHTIWLTTSNPRDPIQKRIRMGYELIRPEMVPGWDGLALKTGDYAGVVGINEMVAARIPTRLYQMFMAEAHHNMPLSEEDKIRSNIRGLAEQARAEKADVEEEEGMAELGNRARAVPRFG